MRGLILILTLIALAGCGGSGGGGSNPPPIDPTVTIGGVAFLPSTSNRYLPGLTNGRSITYLGFGYVDGMTLRLTATDKTVQGVPAKEVQSLYYNALGNIIQQSRYTYAVSQTNRVYVIEANGLPTGPTFIQPLLSSIPTAQLDGYTWTDGYGDTIRITYPEPIYYDVGVLAISLVGASSTMDYLIEEGFYGYILINSGATTSTWVWSEGETAAPTTNG
jgi:hypothetical protein